MRTDAHVHIVNRSVFWSLQDFDWDLEPFCGRFAVTKRAHVDIRSIHKFFVHACDADADEAQGEECGFNRFPLITVATASCDPDDVIQADLDPSITGHVGEAVEGGFGERFLELKEVDDLIGALIGQRTGGKPGEQTLIIMKASVRELFSE